MKKLSEVTNDMQNTVKQMGIGIENSTCQHGLTTEDGNQTGLSKSLKAEGNQEIGRSRKQQSEECYEQKTPIFNCAESKKKLTKLVTSCFKALNTYGATSEDLESVVMIMQMTLGKYDYATVRVAFENYMTQNSTMPTPADIIKIIEPPKKKPNFNATAFIDIKRRKREGQFITRAEEQYCDDYIQASIYGESDEREALLEGVNQVKLEDKRYWSEQ